MVVGTQEGKNINSSIHLRSTFFFFLFFILTIMHRSPRVSYAINVPKTSRQTTYTRYRIDEGAFHNACNKASEDPTSTAIEIINLAGTHCPIVICELAQICLTGPVGRMGSRAALRSVALILLDTVLRDMPHFSRALCLKGQALLPPEHGGWAPPMDETTCGTDGGNGNDNDNDNIELAYTLFDSAARQGYGEGIFLKGRFLVTTVSIHGSINRARFGLDLVKKAAMEKGIARAYVFTAICYEYPDKYVPSLCTALDHMGSTEREKKILELYERAAELGDAAAMNDMGSSVETEYGGLKADFEAAKNYYVRAIQAGYVNAFENLGALYEMGMGGKASERIDVKKALGYYKLGAQMRSFSCAYYLAQVYDEGIKGTLERNCEMAARLYKQAMLCASDSHDNKLAAQILKDLCALYVTRAKIHPMTSAESTGALRCLRQLLGKKGARITMASVEKNLVRALTMRKKGPLEKLVTSRNSGRILAYCKGRLHRRNSDNYYTNNIQVVEINHLFGDSAEVWLKHVRKQRQREHNRKHKKRDVGIFK